MKKFARIILFAVFSALLVFNIAGCSKKEEKPVQTKEKTEVQTVKNVKLKIGASPTPHAEILHQTAATLKQNGVDLEVIEFDDYVMPNLALDNGDIDANFIQHLPYLEDFNKKNKLKNKLVSAVIVHFEPLGIYPGKSQDLSNIKNGSVIGIPSDPTNGARSLWLLDSLGILKVKEDAGFEATEMDIAENPNNIKIRPLEAAQIPASLPDLDFGVINGNYALGAKIMDSVLASESRDSMSAKTFGNVIAVREADLNKKEIQELIKALKDYDIKNFIETKYKGVVIPME